MKAAPPISVLLPVRDGGVYLQEAIASLEGQTEGDFEVIAVDDGSRDGSLQTLQAWAERDRRVCVVQQPASGIVAALEAARARAKGRYLARMDADDISEPRRFEAQLHLLETSPDLMACGSLVRYFPRAAVRDGAERYESWINGSWQPESVAREIFVECPLAHPTFFLRAEAVEAVGGYRDRGWPEDYDLLLRLWEAGGRLAKVPEVLLQWREGPDRLSRTHECYGPDAFTACKVHFLLRTLLRERPGAVIWGSGPVGKGFSRALSAAGGSVRAFVDVDPRKIGQEIHGAPVLEPAQGLLLSGVLHLAAVGQKGARERLRGMLTEGGLTELEGFVAVA